MNEFVPNPYRRCEERCRHDCGGGALVKELVPELFGSAYIEAGDRYLEEVSPLPHTSSGGLWLPQWFRRRGRSVAPAPR